MATAEISFLASNKIYSVINSDDKQYIGLFKINSKNDDNYVVTTVLYNKDLEKKEKQYLNVSMHDKHDYLTEFSLDDEGDFSFLRAVQAQENDKGATPSCAEKRLCSKQKSAIFSYNHISDKKVIEGSLDTVIAFCIVSQIFIKPYNRCCLYGIGKLIPDSSEKSFNISPPGFTIKRRNNIAFIKIINL